MAFLRRKAIRWAPFLATVVVSVLIVGSVDAPEAGASVPLWAVDAADDIKEGCSKLEDIAVEFMGTGTANLAWAAPPALVPAGASLAGTGVGTAAVGGGIAATTGTVGLAVATFVGVGCTTIKVGDWLFPRPEPVEKVPLSDIHVGPRQDCSLTGTSWAGVQPGDQCIVVTVERTTSLTDVYLMPRTASQKLATGVVATSGDWLGERLRDGTVATATGETYVWSAGGTAARTGAQQRLYSSSTGQVVWAFPCATPEVKCGLVDSSWTAQNATTQWFIGADLRRRAAGSANVVATQIPMATADQANGMAYRMRAQIQCKRPLDSDIQYIDESSPVWFGLEGGIENWTSTCPVGYAPIDVDLRRQRARGGMTAPAVWENDGGVTIDWAINPSVRDNPTSLQCWVVGVTSCPIWEPEGAPSAPTRIGGPDGVPQPRTSPTVGTQTIPTLLGDAPWPAEEPETPPTTVPTPTTTPTVTTTTVGTSTTLPDAGTGGTPPSRPPSPTPSPTEPGDSNSWGSCVDDMTEGAWDDVNINPVTWVRALIQYMVSPIICALWWLFVPEDGWFFFLDRFRTIFDESPVLAPFRAFAENLTVDVTACMPVDLPDVGPIVTPSIDVAMCGNPIVMMVWGVAIALGLLAVAKEVLRTMSGLSRFSGGGVGSSSPGPESPSGDESGGGPDIKGSGSWEDYGTGGSFT